MLAIPKEFNPAVGAIAPFLVQPPTQLQPGRSTGSIDRLEECLARGTLRGVEAKEHLFVEGDPKAFVATYERYATKGTELRRQFGILDLQGRSAGHSGLTNGYVSQDIQGQVPGTKIFYSIQGNILRPGNVMPNAVQAFK